MFQIAILLAFVAIASARPLQPPTRAFQGESVVKCKLDTPAKRAAIEAMEEAGMDVWKQYPTGHTDMRVNAAQLDALRAADIACETMIPDLAAVIAEASERRSKYTHRREVYFTEYHNYTEQVSYYQDLCSSVSFCSYQAVGRSYEGRNQYEYVISTNPSNPAFFLDAGIHAREWISSTTLQFIFTNLINTASQANSLASRYTWIIHGHQNPDGYEYSWLSDNNRLWRKSRNINQGSACIGTDLNRNWPTTTWGGGGSSPNACSDTYHGSSAGSEPEVQNLIARFNNALATYDVLAAISFHSYSQLILRPWGHTQQDAPDEDELFDLGAAMQQAIRQTSGLVYDNIKSIELYVTTGTTSDWYYQITQSRPRHTLGYTYELRDQGRYGFELPEDQIIPQGEEIWAATIALADHFADRK